LKTAVYLTLTLALLISSVVTMNNLLATANNPDVTPPPLVLAQNTKVADPTYPWTGVKVSMFTNGSTQYVNYLDYFYVSHGWSSGVNWSGFTTAAQNAFLDPSQTNFTLATNATHFLNPSMTQFKYYNSTGDEMLSLFWFQFHPEDLAPGAYSFTGTWNLAAAANPPNYTAVQDHNTITLIVKSQTIVSCSPNPVSIGHLVTCTATVYGANPTGSVAWSTSSTTGAFTSPNGTLLNGTCSTTYSDNYTGHETITASYSGDPNNSASSGSTTLTVFINVTTGTNITVQPTNDLGLTFANVNVSGTATADKTPIPPAPAPPLNNTVGQYYNINVAASYSGNITVSIAFDGSNMTQQQKSNLKMMQYTPLTADMSGPTPGIPDGVVNMRDIAYIIAHFNTVPNSTNWDPTCDIYGPNGVPDGIVNMRDIAYAVACFGQTSSWISITAYVDTANNIIYGQTTHFSFIGIHG